MSGLLKLFGVTAGGRSIAALNYSITLSIFVNTKKVFRFPSQSSFEHFQNKARQIQSCLSPNFPSRQYVHTADS